jgi:transposase
VERRASLAILLFENPAMENRAAARLLGLHENTIRNWRKRWVQEGFSLEDKPRSGRRRSFSPSRGHGDQKHRV